MLTPPKQPSLLAEPIVLESDGFGALKVTRAAAPSPLACYDCGLPYGDPGWADVVVTDNVWLKISPTGHEGGVLCFACICRRLDALGMRNVPFLVTSGPLAFRVR